MKILSVKSLREWMARILAAEGTDPDVAAHVVEGLVQTSLRGVDSHGVRLFPHYVGTLRAGGVNGRPKYKFYPGLPSCGALDADHTFGHAAGSEAMQWAIRMAKETGTGSVAVRHSSHFGAAAYFALQAAEQDMIGMAFTHSDALLLTSGGRKPYLGPNPICFAAPCDGEEPFCLDMSCSPFSWNKVRQYRDGKEKLPAGVAVDDEGHETRDAQLARALLPIGDYKGYGLSMMVEILCSLLTGMAFGKHLLPMFNVPLDKRRNLGHFFVAINISGFTPVKNFKYRLKSMMDEIRNEPRFENVTPILVPGDPEKNACRKRQKSGVPLSDAEWMEFQKLMEEYQLDVRPVKRNRKAAAR